MIKEEKARNPHQIGFFFWILFAVNYLIMGNRYFNIPIPISLTVEIFYVLAIIQCIVKNKEYGGTMRMAFMSLFGPYFIWLIYAILEVGNMTSDIPYKTICYRWFAEVRTMGFQVVYGLLIYSTIFNTRQKIRKYHRIWGIFILAALGKCLMQQHFGFDAGEREFLVTASKTHFVNGIIRYFSFFSDAANFGSNMACTTVVFAALSFTTRQKKDKIFFAIVAIAALYNMMASGTRSAIIALAIGLMVYAILSKNFSAIIYTGILGMCTIGFLMFTNIGQGNSMIRRMRSAFNKNDASLGARETNKLAMRHYLDEVPIGIGAGIQNTDIPSSNRCYYLSIVPPDSTWVYVNIRYGDIGKYIFLFSFFGMCGYGAYITLTKIKEKEVVGQMAATVSGATAMTVAGYSNQIMLQYPNCMLFFGALGMLCVAEVVDKKARIEREEETRLLLEKQAAEDAMYVKVEEV